MTNFDNHILVQIKDIIYSHIDKKNFRIFLFGSRATGTNKNSSDYDIGIEGETEIDFDQYLSIRSAVGELPANIDIVDFSNVSEEFKEIAKRKIIYL